MQQVVIDLEDEFATLREEYDYIPASKGSITLADTRSTSLLAQ